MAPLTAQRQSPWFWLRSHLFNSWFNGVLSCLLLMGLAWVFLHLGYWVLIDAEWRVIGENLKLLLAGRYPDALLWRVWLCGGLCAAIAGGSWGALSGGHLWQRQAWGTLLICTAGALLLCLPGGITASLKVLFLVLLFSAAAQGGKTFRSVPQNWPWLFPVLWLVTYGILLWLLQGGLGLTPVPIDELSSLILTLLAASISIMLSFPLGILLALGRQSRLPILRYVSIAYIELIRGLPLIGILFMAQVMLPLVLPIRPDRVVRAIAGFTIFSVAYLAENVRGGLQAIPSGQQEAARALGFNYLQTLWLIVLPQALRTVVPAMIGQFISLFKDTSLLAIVSLVDLLGMAQLILGNPKFVKDYAEIYCFVALIYWGCCYAMAQLSRQLETDNRH